MGSRQKGFFLCSWLSFSRHKANQAKFERFPPSLVVSSRLDRKMSYCTCFGLGGESAGGGGGKRKKPRKLPSKGRNTFDYIKAKAKGSVIPKNELPDDAKRMRKKKQRKNARK